MRILRSFARLFTPVFCLFLLFTGCRDTLPSENGSGIDASSKPASENAESMALSEPESIDWRDALYPDWRESLYSRSREARKYSEAPAFYSAKDGLRWYGTLGDDATTVTWKEETLPVEENQFLYLNVFFPEFNSPAEYPSMGLILGALEAGSTVDTLGYLTVRKPQDEREVAFWETVYDDLVPPLAYWVDLSLDDSRLFPEAVEELEKAMEEMEGDGEVGSFSVKSRERYVTCLAYRLGKAIDPAPVAPSGWEEIEAQSEVLAFRSERDGLFTGQKLFRNREELMDFLGSQSYGAEAKNLLSGTLSRYDEAYFREKPLILDVFSSEWECFYPGFLALKKAPEREEYLLIDAKMTAPFDRWGDEAGFPLGKPIPATFFWVLIEPSLPPSSSLASGRGSFELEVMTAGKAMPEKEWIAFLKKGSPAQILSAETSKEGPSVPSDESWLDSISPDWREFRLASGGYIPPYPTEDAFADSRYGKDYSVSYLGFSEADRTMTVSRDQFLFFGYSDYISPSIIKEYPALDAVIGAVRKGTSLHVTGMGYFGNRDASYMAVYYPDLPSFAIWRAELSLADPALFPEEAALLKRAFPFREKINVYLCFMEDPGGEAAIRDVSFESTLFLVQNEWYEDLSDDTNVMPSAFAVNSVEELASPPWFYYRNKETKAAFRAFCSAYDEDFFRNHSLLFLKLEYYDRSLSLLRGLKYDETAGQYLLYFDYIATPYADGDPAGPGIFDNLWAAVSIETAEPLPVAMKVTGNRSSGWETGWTPSYRSMGKSFLLGRADWDALLEKTASETQIFPGADYARKEWNPVG